MREIKYRVWDGKEMQELSLIGLFTIFDNNPCLYTYDSDGNHLLYYKDTEPMQFTGLLDKNGVEIYEGDLIRRDGRFIEKVFWEDGSFHTIIVAPEDLLAHPHRGQIYDNLKYWKKQGVEVIGNIYENGDLLK